MADGIKVGDVVQLKSGGPQMTVRGIRDYSLCGRDQARCTWFDRSNDLKDRIFEIDMLKKVWITPDNPGSVSPNSFVGSIWWGGNKNSKHCSAFRRRSNQICIKSGVRPGIDQTKTTIRAAIAAQTPRRRRLKTSI